MPDAPSGRLVVLMGPSCVGKSPLQKALARLRPDLQGRLQPVVLYNSRPPRPGERDGVDYHFRARDAIDALRGEDRYVVQEVRGDLQALDVQAVLDGLEASDLLYEGNPFVGETLLSHPRLASVRRLSVFLSPLSREEYERFTAPEAGIDAAALVTDLMRRKLLRRMRRQKGELSLPDLEEVERRAGSAWGELAGARLCDHVLPNHDGEDSEHWDAFAEPVGDAGRAFRAFVDLLEGRSPSHAERWDDLALP